MKKTYALFVSGKQGYVRVCFNTDFGTVLQFARNKYANKNWYMTDNMVYGRGITLAQSKPVKIGGMK